MANNKICVICGKIFTTITHNAKYCPDCRAEGHKRAQRNYRKCMRKIFAFRLKEAEASRRYYHAHREKIKNRKFKRLAEKLKEAHHEK